MSWQSEVRHLRRKLRMRQSLVALDLESLDALLAEAEVCRDTLEKLVQGCQYIGPSHRDSDGLTEMRYEGAAALTKEQWTLVELFMGDL